MLLLLLLMVIRTKMKVIFVSFTSLTLNGFRRARESIKISFDHDNHYFDEDEYGINDEEEMKGDCNTTEFIITKYAVSR